MKINHFPLVCFHFRFRLLWSFTFVDSEEEDDVDANTVRIQWKVRTKWIKPQAFQFIVHTRTVGAGLNLQLRVFRIKKTRWILCLRLCGSVSLFQRARWALRSLPSCAEPRARDRQRRHRRTRFICLDFAWASLGFRSRFDCFDVFWCVFHISCLYLFGKQQYQFAWPANGKRRRTGERRGGKRKSVDWIEDHSNAECRMPNVECSRIHSVIPMTSYQSAQQSLPATAGNQSRRDRNCESLAGVRRTVAQKYDKCDRIYRLPLSYLCRVRLEFKHRSLSTQK